MTLPRDVRRKGGGFRAVVAKGDGTRWRGPTRANPEHAAQDAATYRAGMRLQARGHDEQTPCTIAEAFRLLELEQDASGARDGTRDWRQGKFAVLTGPAGWSPGFPLQAITIDSVRRYAKARTDAGVSPATVWRHDIALLRRLISAAMRAERLDQDPLAGLRTPRYRRGRYRIVPPDEVERIARLCEASSRRSGRRDAAVLRFLVGTGLRRSELARLRLVDIDWQRGVIRVEGKTRNRDVPIRGLAADSLRVLCERVRSDGLLFRKATSVEAVFQRVKRAHGVSISAHGLRHCFATTAVVAGVQPFVLMTLLGHSDIRQSAHYYTSGSPEQVDAIEKVARLLHGQRSSSRPEP